jgi:large subunit ribosomal protein L18
MLSPKDKYRRRAQRVRTKLRATSDGKPRLSVDRSAKHISVQIIDDERGVTLASATTKEKDLVAAGSKSDDARTVGQRIAERAMQAGVTEVVFDRGGYLYHGRVKALAEAAREGGLKF